MANTNLDAVNIEVNISGSPCDFEKIILKQSISTHHTFSIIVSYKPDKPSVWAESPDKLIKQLGSKVSITLTHIQSGASTEFNGVISDINVAGHDGNQGYVILKGGDPTILLDRDPAMACYVEQTLTTIVDDVIGKSGVSISLTNSPRHSAPIPYVSRYKESSYGFLSRLLRSYGEWFYYDGKKLIVGDPSINTKADAVYDIELTELSINASAVNLKNSFYNFDPLEDKFHYESDGSPGGVTASSKAADGSSKPFYPTESILPPVRSVHSPEDIEKYKDFEYNRRYSQLAQVEGKSSYCGIKLGEVVSVSLPDSIPDVSSSSLGTYRVIEITHEFDQLTEYRNTFIGIPNGITTMPWGDAVMPVAYPEMAKVMDNNDPKKQGRVKVQFMWQQKDGGKSDWMRVQSPDAGSSDKVAKNRGFVFIPEKEDLVMVGFEHGDPSRPFVMGSLFYKANSNGADSENKTKSITTRSGVTIIIDDDKGDGSITISDPSGNIFTLGGDKTITISAPDSITMSAKEIIINGEDSISLESKEISNTASSKLSLLGDSGVEMVSKSEVSISAPKVEVDGSKGTVDIKGMSTTVDGSVQTVLSGMMLNIN